MKFRGLQKDLAIMEIKLRIFMEDEENLHPLQNQIKLLSSQLEENLQPVKKLVQDHSIPASVSSMEFCW